MQRELIEMVTEERIALASQVQTNSSVIEGIRKQLVEEDNENILKITTDPGSVKHNLTALLREAREKGGNPSRVRLSVTAVKTLRSMPLIHRAASHLRREPQALVATFDYSVGIIQVLIPLVMAEDLRQGDIAQKVERSEASADLILSNFASADVITSAKLYTRQRKIELAKVYADLLAQDATGFMLLSQTTRKLTEHGAPKPLIPSLFSSGAIVGNRLYRAIYPHTEGIV